ncbi:O-antigen ligase family protein [Halomonas saccharevitans]|uniref:O-antigen ligase n=1 Tax=Halomonas saccharevitans TaxID=416872 RepID=A0A1I7B3M3_9GAMM|nr:O-antigen ligase family protein [Halomonas saccharevitans]SFT81714.1 O-antigen ligase [Halomonas saccharevitans]
MLFAALRLVLPEAGETAGTLMALTGLIAALVWGKGVRSSAPFWLLLGAIAVQLISWVAGYFHHPDWMTDNPQLDRLAKWFLFIGVAWWLGGSTRLTLWVWVLGVAGLLTAVWISDDSLAAWLRGLEGGRVDFGIRNAQHTALFFGAALTGLLCFSQRCLTAGRLAWLRRASWTLGTGMCLIGVGITQTRAVWLGMLPVLLVASAALALHHFAGRSTTRVKTSAWIGFALVCFTVVSAAWAFKGTIENRLERENAIIVQAMEGDWKEIPFSSIGNRLLSWRASVDWIAERPVVGWGEEGRGLVIDHTEWLPPQTRNNFGHLHNTLLELQVSYGALGLLVMSALVVWVGIGTWKAWRDGAMPSDMALFGLAYFVYYMVVNQFESYSFFWTGTYLQALVLGGLVTHIWRWQVESGQRVFPVLFRRGS